MIPFGIHKIRVVENRLSRRVSITRINDLAEAIDECLLRFLRKNRGPWKILESGNYRESKRIVHWTQGHCRKDSYSINFDHPRTVHRARESWKKKSAEQYVGESWKKKCGKERHSRVTDTGRWQQTALSGIDRSVVDASPRLPARSEVIRSISVALCLV